jgi:hypothetical protein
LRTDQSYVGRNPRIVAFVETVGARTVLCVPMLKDNGYVGAFIIFRQEVRPFDEKQIELVWRECQAEDFADEILEIADDSSRDYKKKIGADGKETWVVDRAHIARCRLRIATRKRILAWMAPRKYGNG